MRDVSQSIRRHHTTLETVNVPVWAGVVAIVIGGGLLLFTGKRL